MTADVEHRQGCPATGGYGHGVEPCICGAATVVELLPLPDHGTIATKQAEGIIKAWATDYARANVEASTEALRAEVAKQSAYAKRTHDWNTELLANNERLAEALDIIARVGKASRNQTTRTRWIVARAISALNGDDDWQALSKPKGFHDALLNPTAAQGDGNE